MQEVYCPAIERTVWLDPMGAESVCYGYQPDLCRGMCPLVRGTSAAEMGRRFAATEFAEGRFLTTRARCEACGATMPMRLVGPWHLLCSGCGRLGERFG